MSLRALVLAALTCLSIPTAWASSGGDGGPPPPEVDLTSLPASATATPAPLGKDPHPVVARLLAEHDQVAPGDTLSLGVLLEQTAEWHTYWKSPGDIGLPTQIQWTLPEGMRAGEHVYPIPVRYDQEGMVSYGYDHQVLHVADVAVPADMATGTHEVKAHVEWLVCKTSCIPGAVDLSLPITVGEPAALSAAAPLFAHTRTRWPSAPEGLVVDVAFDAEPVLPNTSFKALMYVHADAGHTVDLLGHDVWPTFAPIAGMDWMIDGVRMVEADDGAFIIVDATTFEPDPLPANDLIGGLFQVKVDGHPVAAEVTRALPWASSGDRVAKAAALWALLAEAEGADAVAEAADPVVDNAEAPPIGDPVSPPLPTDPATAWSLPIVLGNLFAAFIGGLILNVMPCVLPVIMLKLYGLVEQGGISDAEKRTAGLSYTGGILVSFWLLAFAVWVARVVLGNEVGWGFQMQYPGYVATLTTLVFVFALSLFGVFEIPAFGTDSASDLGSREGPAGYFFTGVFATLVATPCSAPILGAAIAFAFQAPMWLLVTSFSFIGLGLASPFLVIAFVPAAYKLLPAPGAWMETFKQFIGFTLVATAIWLMDVLTALIGPDRAIGYLAFLATVSIGTWIYGRFGGVAAEGRRQLASAAMGLLVAGLGAYTFLDVRIDDAPVCDDGSLATDLSFDEHIPWQPFSEPRLDALAGQTVFVDFTADWCVSCKVNEKTVLETSTVRASMADHGVVPLVADWTKRDEVITAWLKRFGRAGVPMYLVIPPTGPQDAILLPEVITPGMVTDALAKAAAACPEGQVCKAPASAEPL